MCSLFPAEKELDQEYKEGAEGEGGIGEGKRKEEEGRKWEKWHLKYQIEGYK